MGVNCSICGIAPEEVDAIKRRGEVETPPGAVHLFHPSDQASQVPGYEIHLHREFQAFHAGYPGGIDGDYSGDQHCLRYVSLPNVKAIAQILSTLSFAQFIEKAYAAFPPDHEMHAFRSSVHKLSSYYDEIVSLYRRAAENNVALMVMLA